MSANYWLSLLLTIFGREIPLIRLHFVRMTLEKDNRPISSMAEGRLKEKEKKRKKRKD